jgi:hypothetical protein
VTAAIDSPGRLPGAVVQATSRVHLHCGTAREQAVDQAEHLEIAAAIDRRRDAENDLQTRLSRTLEAAYRRNDADTIRACIAEMWASLERERELDQAADWHERAVRAKNAGVVTTVSAAMLETAALLGIRHAEPLPELPS